MGSVYWPFVADILPPAEASAGYISAQHLISVCAVRAARACCYRKISLLALLKPGCSQKNNSPSASPFTPLRFRLTHWLYIWWCLLGKGCEMNELCYFFPGFNRRLGFCRISWSSIVVSLCLSVLPCTQWKVISEVTKESASRVFMVLLLFLFAFSCE